MTKGILKCDKAVGGELTAFQKSTLELYKQKMYYLIMDTLFGRNIMRVYKVIYVLQQSLYNEGEKTVIRSPCFRKATDPSLLADFRFLYPPVSLQHPRISVILRFVLSLPPFCSQKKAHRTFICFCLSRTTPFHSCAAPAAVCDTGWFQSAWEMRSPSHRLSVTLSRIKVNTAISNKKRNSSWFGLVEAEEVLQDVMEFKHKCYRPWCESGEGNGACLCLHRSTHSPVCIHMCAPKIFLQQWYMLKV